MMDKPELHPLVARYHQAVIESSPIDARTARKLFFNLYWNRHDQLPIQHVAEDAVIYHFASERNGALTSHKRLKNLASNFRIILQNDGLIDEDCNLTRFGERKLLEANPKYSQFLLAARDIWNSKFVIAISLLSLIASVGTIISWSIQE